MEFYDSHVVQQCVNEILWQPRDRAVRGWTFMTATWWSNAWMRFCDSHAIQQCVNDILWLSRDRAVREWNFMTTTWYSSAWMNFMTATRYSSAWMKLCDSHAIQQCVNETSWQPCDRAVREWNFTLYFLHSSSDLDKIRHRYFQKYTRVVLVYVVESDLVKALLYLRAWLNFCS